MKLSFTKMQGIGNDFIVVDGYSQPVSLDAAAICRLADRHFGVGFDQLLLVERPTIEGVDFRYRIFNADGGEVEQCGNGARCFVRFVHDKALTSKREIRVQTARGIILPRLEDNGLVTVNMGEPRFEPEEVPFIADREAVTYSLQVASQTLEISTVSMGNPHAVAVVGDVDTAPVESLGPLVERHERFPQRVNAGFMQVLDSHHIRLRVFERGSGETLACGTGACAAVVSGIRRGLLQSPVRVATRGGELNIAWDGGRQPVWMTGPAETVFEGSIDI
ncbi:diaminopimelate epimerase [Methylobacillus flagellatus]|uniref:diaminopimelate epimerase n=1 Tax=Methylobacillus flagellatus TaxID=405 RepID=UPI002853974F|nr:diaminopimelate epimerase [Methylobacillus flagellatus]MDR5170213.1 diaminopimelate epimerase [Methylobacillus flagellatus]